MDFSSFFSGLSTLGTSIAKAVVGPQIATVPAGTQIVGAVGNTLIAQQTASATLSAGLGSLFSNPLLLIVIFGLIAVFAFKE